MNMQTNGRRAHFLFSFGPHRDARDFARAKEAADSFRPHVYSPESASLTYSQRVNEFVPSNKGLRKARKEAYLKRAILANFESEQSQRHDYEFQREQLRYTLEASSEPVFYPLEAHETSFHRGNMEKINHFHMDSIRKASLNDLGAAKSQMHESIKLFTESNRKRDLDIVRNMENFVPELFSLFSSLQRFDPLRIFVRLGTLHENVFKMVQDAYAGHPKVILNRHRHEADNALLPFEQAQWDSLAGMQVRDEQLLRSVLAFILMEKYGNEIGGRENYSKEPLVHKVSYGLAVPQIEGLVRANAIKDQKADLRLWLNSITTQAEILVGIRPSN